MRRACVGPLTCWVPWEWEVLMARTAPWAPFPLGPALPIMPQRVGGADDRPGCAWWDHRTILWGHQAP